MPPTTAIAKAKPRRTANARPESLIVKRARAAQMLVELASGKSHKQVAEQFGVHTSTVREAIRFAEREGFFEKADEAIRNRLIPLALDAVERKLKREIEEGEAEIALKVLTGVRLLSSNGAAPVRGDLHQASDQIEEAEVTWEQFVMTRKTIKASQEPPQIEVSEAVEGEVMEGEAQEGDRTDSV